MLLGEQIRAARQLVRMSQHDLAEGSGVSLETIKRIEAIRGVASANSRTLEAIQNVLEDAGIQFIESNGGGPGIRLRETPKGAA